MKKIKFIIFMLPLFIAFGCEKDPQGGELKINATVVNGNDYNDLIDEVRAFTVSTSFDIEYEIASSKYVNGSFNIVLPNRLNLAAFTAEYQGELCSVIPHGHLFAYKNGNRVGEFIYKSESYSTVFIYRDGRRKYISDNETVVHLNEDDMGAQIKVKAGWSIIYFEGLHKASTTKPKQEFNWYFIPTTAQI